MDIPKEEILSLNLIRHHTKTEDISYVTDEQLELYRDAGIEAAEQYTGKHWRGFKEYKQSAAQPSHKWRSTYKLRLDYPTADDLVTLVTGNKSQNYFVQQGAKAVRLNVDYFALDVSDCCGRCGNDANFGDYVYYNIGVKCADDIPAGIKTGILKYIAWMISNPGDEILTVRNKSNTTGANIQGSNDAAIISGAADEWRRYRNAK